MPVNYASIGDEVYDVLALEADLGIPPPKQDPYIPARVAIDKADGLNWQDSGSPLLCVGAADLL